MRSPAFWWTPRPTLAARLLSPLGALYGALTMRRMNRPGTRLSVPVVCVGNLVAGGAGKTPVALAIARLLQAEGCRPAFLSRGYGRQRASHANAVLEVDIDCHAARECGDEPMLLARVAPTFVSGDRLAAAKAAVAAGADLLILDDGLQNPTLAKDLVIAVSDAGAGNGNGLCVPAGPLRAAAGPQWPHVSLLCVVGGGAPGEAVAAEARAAGVPVLAARIEPDRASIERLRGDPVFAFAGIGRPDKFFASLDAAGLHVAGRRAFPDHHVFSARDLDALRSDARQAGARLVTTGKDRVRLPRDFPVAEIPIELVFADAAQVAAALRRVWRRA